MTQPPSQGGFPPPGQFPPQPTQPQGGFAQQPAQPQGGFATPQGGYAQQPAPQPQFPPPSQGGGGGGGGGGPMGGVDVDAKKAEAAGFLKSLVDFSFESFVSPRVLKVLYGFWLFMLVPSVFALFFSWYTALTYENYDYMTGQTSSDPQFGMFCGSTVAYPIMVFMWVLMGRILFERSILAFRQYELDKQILEELRKR